MPVLAALFTSGSRSRKTVPVSSVGRLPKAESGSNIRPRSESGTAHSVSSEVVKNVPPTLSRTISALALEASRERLDISAKRERDAVK